MKSKLKIAGLIFVLFLIFGLYICEAEDKYYFVKIKNENSLFSAEDSGEYIVNGDELEEYLEAGIVEWYEEDYEVELFDEEPLQSDNSYFKWDLELINAGMSGKIRCVGQKVKVGVIDSGIVNHPALLESILEGYNFLDNTTDVTDNKGHGTFVSGMITADENDSGVTGIAPLADIVPLKCFDNGVKTRVSTIISAIEAAVEVYDCDIINMSFGITSYSEKLEEAVKNAVDKGVILVASVGNGGGEGLYYPAAYDEVIGVGSVDKNNEKSYFSQYNSSVFVTAPGEEVISTSKDGGYSAKSGTSFSAPLVSGMIAVMKSVDEDISFCEVKEYLKSSSSIPANESEASEGYCEEYGYGIINLGKCVEMMLKEFSIFISVLDAKGGQSRIFIYNNSDSMFEGVCLWAGFDRCLRNIEYQQVSIPPGEGTELKGSLSDETVRCFVWKGAKDITAISNVREMRLN